MVAEASALARTRRPWRRQCGHAELRFKPYWEVGTAIARGRSEDGALSATVDGLTGIARCRRSGTAPELERRSIEVQRMAPVTIEAARAAEIAGEAIRRVARRKRVELGRAEEPVLFYKPVWLLARSASHAPSYVVDGHSGLLVRALS